MTSIGLTDHGNLHGALKFYQSCRKQGIRPIIGYEAYVTNTISERVRGAGTTHLTILAKNTTGYRNLLKLASAASTEGFYVRPRIDSALLLAYREGLIILSGCIGGEVSRKVLNGELEAAQMTAEWYARHFRDDFYLEIQENGTEVQRRARAGIVELSGLVSVPLVATADCHYTNPDDADLQDVMVCITTGKIRAMPKEAPRLEEDCYYLRDESEMLACFPDNHDAVHRSGLIAEQCEVEIETGVRHFPVFNVPSFGQKPCCPHPVMREHGDTESRYAYIRRDDGTTVLAHRVAFAEHLGVDLKDLGNLVVCHTCDTPRCCEPSHLFPGTRADNNNDMARKGRAPSAGRKITLEQEQEIITSNEPQQVLADRYGLSQGQISTIKSGGRKSRRMDDSEVFLRKTTFTNLILKGKAADQSYVDRLERELGIIADLGFSPYFNIVWDFCEWARKRGIYSTARGSGVGSLVCYCLGISHVDPIEYGLLFERFLDPSRREAPDLDIDFDKEWRSEVMEYVKDKYGRDCACQIGTFGTFGAKMALKDVGKVECVSSAKVQKLAGLIPELPGTTLEGARGQIEELSTILDTDPQSERLYRMAQRIEGMAKSVGTHAAGVVIADQPLTNYVPVMRGKDGSLVTQWDMGDCEAVGLLKMDFLGLRNLTILQRCVDIIEDRTGKRINVHKIPMDDQEVYADLAAGKTAGVFQLEPTGMTGLLIRMKPTTLENIIACIALYRPGPLDAGMVDEYVAVKNGERRATYAHPAMEQILGYTYGVMVYQEQVMMVLNQVGNIPLSESYSCIKAISKKIKEKVEKYKPMFVKGCSENGVDGEALWEQIGTFARYGFNKSHSTAYAFIAYQTAWLKHYFPVEFMAALLSCDISQRSYTGRDSLCSHLDDCRRQGIEVVMPNVNTCGPDFRVRDGRIYFGLDAIKGVPHSASVAIAAAQPFSDLFDFCAKVPKQACPRAAIRNLIHVGAMPGGQTRESMEATIDRAMKLAEGSYKNPDKQAGKWNPGQERSTQGWLALERELTGIFITGHPIDQSPWLSLLGAVRPGEGTALVGGVVTTIEERFTHSGKKFVTFILDSRDHVTECIMWEPQPSMLRLVKDGALVVVRGISNRRGSNGTLTVNSIRTPEDYLRQHKLGLVVETPACLAQWVREVVSRFPGNDSFAVIVDGIMFMSDLKVNLTRDMLGELKPIPKITVNIMETRVENKKPNAV